MVYENNLNRAAKGTDYFICDIEYANKYGRFDLIAVHWPSSSAHHKNNKNLGLAFIEMKYMNKSMKNTAGILSHVRDMQRYFTQNDDQFAALKEEMKTVLVAAQEININEPLNKDNGMLS